MKRFVIPQIWAFRYGSERDNVKSNLSVSRAGGFWMIVTRKSENSQFVIDPFEHKSRNIETLLVYRYGAEIRDRRCFSHDSASCK
jgi:hypothetical protein